MTKLVINTDGGARGNPGPAALGVVLGDKHYAEAIGRTTNNVAEYRAVVFALKKAKQLLGKKKAAEAEIEVRTDSELMQRQLTGRYKIENKDLQPLFMEIWNLRLDFKKVDFIHVPRAQNSDADKLVNEALDAAEVNLLNIRT